jgi:hypothetical protein
MNEVKVEEANFWDVSGDIIRRFIEGVYNSGMPGMAYNIIRNGERERAGTKGGI